MRALPGALPAHARFQVFLPIAGAFIGFIGFVMTAAGGRHNTTGQVLMAAGGLVGGFASAAILYNTLHARYAAVPAPT